MLIDFSNVNANTNYKDLSNWLPTLKNIKDIKFEKLVKEKIIPDLIQKVNEIFIDLKFFQ